MNNLDWRLRQMLDLDQGESDRSKLFDDSRAPAALAKRCQLALEDLDRNSSEPMDKFFAVNDQIMQHRARLTNSTPGPIGQASPSVDSLSKGSPNSVESLAKLLLGEEDDEPALPRLERIEDLHLGRPVITPRNSGKSLLDSPIHEVLERAAARIPNAQGRAFAKMLAAKSREWEAA